MITRISPVVSIVALISCLVSTACVGGGASGKDAPPNSSATPPESGTENPEQSEPESATIDGRFAAAPEGLAENQAAPEAEVRSGAGSSADDAPSYSPPAASPGGAARPSTPGLPKGEAKAAPMRQRAERPGLATSWGETRTSYVTTVDFVRASYEPVSVLRIQYDDQTGILARAGLRYESDLVSNYVQTPRGFVSVQVVDQYGSPLSGYSDGSRSFVVGENGARYSIQITNHSSQRFEIVATVDGLDVIDGRPASYNKRGYLLSAYETLDIDGFRRSSDAVAAFRFGSVKDSYAARTGSDRNVGVIGVAVFAERGAYVDSRWQENRRRDQADPFPQRYAAPPPRLPMVR